MTKKGNFPKIGKHLAKLSGLFSANEERFNCRIYSIKPRGAHLIFVLFGMGLIRGRGFFEARTLALQLRWQVLSCNEKGKRTREVGLVVPAKFVAYTT